MKAADVRLDGGTLERDAGRSRSDGHALVFLSRQRCVKGGDPVRQGLYAHLWDSAAPATELDRLLAVETLLSPPHST